MNYSITSILFFLIFRIGYCQNTDKIILTDIFVSNTNGVKEFRIPALITTKKGALLAVCDARMERKGDPPNNIDQVLRRSLDNGKTWQEMETILDFPNQEGAADPQLVQDPKTERIFLFYGYCPGKNYRVDVPGIMRRYLSLQYVYSDDEGKHWSVPVMVEYGLKKDGWHSMWPGPGRGAVLADGTLIVPLSVRNEKNILSYFIYSDDHGESWQLSSNIGTEINEPTLVELEDGTLMVNARTKTKLRAVVTSNDLGKSWSGISYDSALIEPICQASFIRYKWKNKSILLFSNPSDREKRRNMTVKVSFDNGQTWPLEKTIYKGPSAYSCLTALSNGDIGLLFENGDQGPYERISFVKLDIDWVVGE